MAKHYIDNDPNDCIEIDPAPKTFLPGLGFVYDIEDNLWYDKNKDREKNHLRIGVSGPYMDGTFLYVLFNGGYEYKIGEYRGIKKLSVGIKECAIKNKD